MNDFIAQAQSELQNRIKETNKICETLRKSYSEYSSKSKQKAQIAILVIVFVTLLIAMINSTSILNFFDRQNISRDLFLFIFSLLGVCVYVNLHIFKKIPQIKRIAKIDNLVAQVKNIETYLQSQLNNISNIASLLKKRVFQNNNSEINPERNFETEIKYFSSLANSYAKPDDNNLSKLITVFHWLACIIFVGVFLYISSPLIQKSIYELTKFNEFGFIYNILIAFFSIYLLSKANFGFVFQMHQKFRATFGVLIIIGLIGYAIYFFTSEQTIINNTPETTYDSFTKYIPTLFFTFLPLLLCSIFSSIICDKNSFASKILGIFYMIFTIIILLVTTFPSDLNRYEEYLYTDTLSAVFLINIPFSIAAFFIVIIGLFSKINIKVINYIVLGIGLFYGVLFIINTWNWDVHGFDPSILFLLFVGLGAVGGIWISCVNQLGCFTVLVVILSAIAVPFVGIFVVIPALMIVLFLLPSLLLTIIFAKKYEQKWFGI
ncbi:MAG: hypothetical protein FWG98_10530 [Candidatus Cloacimonetes bacterium]|nr:hypothetical protein [Candidatus Cloacimonadota bacterium]